MNIKLDNAQAEDPLELAFIEAKLLQEMVDLKLIPPP